MTRIVAGTARGRQLRVPAAVTRPTSDRVREALFSSLEHRIGRAWSEVAVLDAFAGSGALGLEAWSRGAASVLLVERDKKAAEVITANIRRLGATDVHCYRGDTWRMPPRKALPQAPERFDLVFLDPPYADSDDRICELLRHLERGDWLSADCLAVVERSARGPQWVWPTSWEGIADRRYSDTMIHLGALVASPSSESNGGS